MTHPALVPARSVRGTVDFGVITVREDEFRAVLSRFQPRWLVRGEEHYNIAELSGDTGAPIRVAILRIAETGHSRAHSAATHLLTELRVSCLVLVGIAGAVPEIEYSLGDVIVATRFYDFSVTATMPDGTLQTAGRGGPSHRLVQTALANLPAIESFLGDWNSESAIGVPLPTVSLVDDNFVGDDAWKEKVRRSLEARFKVAAPRQQPLVTAAPIGSGNLLMKDPVRMRAWLEHARDLKAVEMELPGVFEAVRSIRGDHPVLAIRGISDIVGFVRDPGWTTYACHSAASFAHAFLASNQLNMRLRSQTRRHSAPPVLVSGAGAKRTHEVGQKDPPKLASAGTIAMKLPTSPRWEQVRVFHHALAVRHALFSPDGEWVVTATDNDVSMWHAESGERVAALKQRWVACMIFSPDSARLVTSGEGGTATIWDVPTGNTLEELRGRQRRIHHIAVSPDGQRILTTGSDATAYVWDTASGTMVATL